MTRGAEAAARAIAAIVAFVVLDRLTTLAVPPAARAVSDRQRYHELDQSRKFARLGNLRPTLRTVFVGDSRTRHGVDPRLWSSERGRTTPSAFNFATASSGVELTELLAREYLLDNPRLDLIVWGISPRIFNRYWNDPVLPIFLASSGYRHDRQVRQHARAAVAFDAVMTRLSATYAHRSILKARTLDALSETRRFTVERPQPMNEWGFIEFPRARQVDVRDAAPFLESVASGRFAFDEARWRRFERLVADLDARHIRLLCFVPPMHSSTLRSPSADADATPDADYAQLVARLDALQRAHRNFRFVDLHRGGNNGFSDEQWGDWDHLNASGAARLSRLLDQVSQAPERPAPRGAAAKPVAQTAALPRPAAPPPVRRAPPRAPADTTPPRIVTMLGDLDYSVGAYPPDNRPECWAEFADDGTGIDLSSVRFFLNDEDVTAQCRVTATRVSYTSETPMAAPRLYRFRVVVSDKAGNRAERDWEILLKPC